MYGVRIGKNSRKERYQATLGNAPWLRIRTTLAATGDTLVTTLAQKKSNRHEAYQELQIVLHKHSTRQKLRANQGPNGPFLFCNKNPSTIGFVRVESYLLA
jgi:hypothetical protein